MAIGYWGYPNGNIPTSAMTKIYSRGGNFYLKPDAAYWWLRLMDAYAEKWGVPLEITDGYRTYAEQVYYWNAYQAGWGNVAAYPGTSNHGWAMAVDIYTPSFGGSANAEQHKWLQQNAPSFGWTWTTGKASGESWHWEFTGGLAKPAETKPSVPIYQEEDDEVTIYYKDKDTGFVYGLDTTATTDGLKIIGKQGSPTIAYTVAPITAKVSELTGAQMTELISFHGVKPVTKAFYDKIKVNNVKGLRVA